MPAEQAATFVPVTEGNKPASEVTLKNLYEEISAMHGFMQKRGSVEDQDKRAKRKKENANEENAIDPDFLAEEEEQGKNLTLIQKVLQTVFGWRTPADEKKEKMLLYGMFKGIVSSKYFQKSLDFLKNAAKAAASWIFDLIAFLMVLAIFDPNGAFLMTLVNVLLQVGMMLINLLISVIPQIVATLPRMIMMLIPVVVHVVQMAIGLIVKFLPIVIKLFLDVVMSLIQAIPQILQVLAEGIVTLIPVLGDALVQLLTGIIKMIPTLLAGIVKIIPPLIKALVTAIPLIINAVVDAIPMIIDAFTDPTFIDAVINAFIDIFSDTKMWMNLGKAMLRLLKLQMTPLIFGLTWPFQLVVMLWSKFSGSIAKWLKETLTALKKKFIDPIKQFFNWIYTTFIQPVMNFLTPIIQGIQKVLDAAKNFSIMDLINQFSPANLRILFGRISQAIGFLMDDIGAFFKKLAFQVTELLSGKSKYAPLVQQEYRIENLQATGPDKDPLLKIIKKIQTGQRIDRDEETLIKKYAPNITVQGGTISDESIDVLANALSDAVTSGRTTGTLAPITTSPTSTAR